MLADCKALSAVFPPATSSAHATAEIFARTIIRIAEDVYGTIENKTLWKPKLARGAIIYTRMTYLLQ